MEVKIMKNARRCLEHSTKIFAGKGFAKKLIHSVEAKAVQSTLNGKKMEEVKICK
jgi:hypothetical protein